MKGEQRLHPFLGFLEVSEVTGVGQAKDNFGLFDFLLRALDAKCFDGFGGFADASGVDEAKLNAVDVEDSSMTSRVVPAISETMARSSPRS